MEDAGRSSKYPELVSFRAEEGTKASIEAAAERARMDTAEWLRTVSIEAAEGSVGVEKLLRVVLAEVLAVRGLVCTAAVEQGIDQERLTAAVAKVDKEKRPCVARVLAEALTN